MNENNLSESNYLTKAYQFRDRQAGVSIIYDPTADVYSYNAYCLELVLMKELLTTEYEYLEDAIAFINSEFGNWELKDLQKPSGCGNCAAK